MSTAKKTTAYSMRHEISRYMLHSRGGTSEAHIENRIRIPLLVMIAASAYMEAHMLIEAFCLRVLLIHCQPAYSIAFDSIREQTPAQSHATFRRSDEKHLQLPILYSHESTGVAFIILRSNQDTDAPQRFRHIFTQPADLCLGEETMGCSYRSFPYFSQLAYKPIISFSSFGQYHEME